MPASTSRTVEVVFAGKDFVSEVATTALSSIQSFGSGVQIVGDALGGMAEKILLTEAALIGMGAAFAVVSTQKANEFESAMVEIERVIDSNTESMLGLDDQVLALSNAYGVSASEIGRSVADFRSGGASLADSLTLTANAIEFVKTTGLSSAQATDILKQSMAGFGFEASKATDFLDLLNAVSAEHGVTAGKLGEAMQNLSPIARVTGFSMEEMAALVTPIIRVFGEAGESSNGLKSALLGLLDDAPAFQKAFDDIGLSTTVLDRSQSSSRDVLMAVKEVWGDLTEVQQVAFASQIAGKEQFARFIAVMDAGGETMAILATATERTGATQRELNLVMETGQVAVDRFKVAMENLLIVAGQRFAADMRVAIDAVTEFEIALQQSIRAGSLDGLFVSIAPTLARIADLFKNLAENIDVALRGIDFNRFQVSIEQLVSAITGDFSAFFSGQDIASPEGLISIIQRVIDAIASLTATSAGIIRELQPAFDVAGTAMSAFANANDDLIASIGRLLGQGLLIKEFGTVAGSALIVMQESGITASQAIETLRAGASLAMAELRSGFLTAADAAVGVGVAIVGAANAIPSLFVDDEIEARNSAALASLQATQSGIRASLQDANNALVAAQDNWINYSDVVDKAVLGGDRVVRDFVDTVGLLGSSVAGDVRVAETAIVTSMTAMFEASKHAAVGLQDMSTSASMVSSGMVDTGESLQILTTSTVGLVTGVRGLDDTFQSMIEKEGLAVESTARLTTETNKATPATEGLARASESLAKASEDAKQKMLEHALAVGKLANDFQQSTIESAKVQQSFAQLDIEAAKLQVDADKAGVAFRGVGSAFSEAGGQALSSGVSYSAVSRNISQFGAVAADMAHQLESVSAKGLTATEKVVGLGLAVGNQVVAFQGATTAAANVQHGFAQLDVETAKLQVDAAKAGVEFGGVGNQFQAAGVAAAGVAPTFQSVQRNLVEFSSAIVSMATNLESVSPKALASAMAVAEVGLKSQAATTKMAEVRNASSQIALGFADLEVKSKALDIGFSTAQLEASTRVVQAQFASIDNTISSTGSTLGNLFSQLERVEEFSNVGATLRESIQTEANARAIALEQQRQLTEEALKSARLRNERAQRGDTAITVKAEGLAPALEIIFRKVIEHAQITASAEGAELLTGLAL